MRNLPPALIESLLREEGEEALICFLQVDHPSFDEPARMVCDVVEYDWRGAAWNPVIFDARLLSDRDAPPEARLAFPAFQEIAQGLMRLKGAPTGSLWLLSAADFEAGVEQGTALPVYAFEDFLLVDVQGDAVEISGKLMLRDYATEPWPGVRATQDQFPGLFV